MELHQAGYMWRIDDNKVFKQLLGEVGQVYTDRKGRVDVRMFAKVLLNTILQHHGAVWSWSTKVPPRLITFRKENVHAFSQVI